MINGFLFHGLNVGIKKNKLDLGIIYCPEGANITGVTTQNRFKSPSVLYLNEFINKKSTCALLALNSGNANALTGNQGMADIISFTEQVSSRTGIDKDQILLLSTGIIGKRLPLDTMIKNFPKLDCFSADQYKLFAEAILTTDTKIKTVETSVMLNNEKISFLGIAKGSGMINPHMATMHALIFTDASIETELLPGLISEAAEVSFNRITVDGDCSTNDSFLLLSSNQSSVKIDQNNILLIKDCIKNIAINLAKQIIQDGEGATKFIEVTIKHASSDKEARTIFAAVANSALVKTAIFGENPNFGRILVAAGTVESSIIPEKVELFIGDHLLVKNNTALPSNKKSLDKYMKNKEIHITLNLNNGPINYTGWTTDYSYDYIRINAEYN